MKQNHHHLFSLLLALVLACGLLPTCSVAADETPTFYDVGETDWFMEDVKYVYQNGLMSGMDDNLFSPQDSMTRGMLVTILHRMEGAPAAKAHASFLDVSQDAYYADAVAWASENGLVAGYDERHFRPEIAVTREQVAVLLYRYAATKNCNVEPRADLSIFADYNSISSYAEDALSWAVETGLLTGVGSSTLLPADFAYRSQAAALLHRFCVTVTNRAPVTDPPAFVPAGMGANSGMDGMGSNASIFAELGDVSFYFSSGAGGWSTSLDIYSDGSFVGNFNDSDMGSSGEGYPYGTVYYCNFRGKFSQPEKINDFEYSFQLESLTQEGVDGEATIEDSVRYVVSNPYGMDDGKEFRLYLPGSKTADLPQPFVEWVGMPRAWGSDVPSELSFWGLYNVNGEMGFGS